MRVMDGLMAIPRPACWRSLSQRFPGPISVIVALIGPECRTVVCLVRSLVLSLREQPYVEAAVALGASFWRVVFRHLLPNALAPVVGHVRSRRLRGL